MTDNILALFATNKCQGMRASDFCWTHEGELVTFSTPCDTDNDDIDGTCGCLRSMSGLSSAKATTTFTVGVLAGGKHALREALTNYWVKGGWSRMFNEQELSELIETDLDELLSIASDFPLGSVLEIRGDIIQVRSRFS